MADEIDISRADLSREDQIALLRRSSVKQWNAWRESHRDIRPDLTRAVLIGANLTRADLHEAVLTDARLFRTNLTGARLTMARLSRAGLSKARLTGADLTKADLTRAVVVGANLSWAVLVNTSLVDATLDGCWVYGASVWNVRLNGARQANLRITELWEPAITVDDLRVAQFLYLLLNNQEIRAVLDTIASKVVLVLGRFSTERKPALDALREALRQHPKGYIPVLFDFDKQPDKPVLETVKTLANLARFVVVDLTEPNMVRSELTYITANVPTVPIRPLIEGDAKLPTEVETWAAFRSFLPIYRYRDIPQLITALDEAVITPVEQYVRPRPIVERPS
jgi:uncharacterized protein YjbI with pentapeptide repeats